MTNKFKCEQCGSFEMDFISCYDDPNTGYAYNLYQCDCGTIVKEDVWDNKGLTWILEDGEIRKTPCP